MDEFIFKNLGMYLLLIFEAIFVFLAFMIGNAVNGIAPELAVMLGSMLAASDVFVILLIKHFFKLEE